MISGSELRNTFNLIMRDLFTIKDDSSPNVGGRYDYSSINSISYIDIYVSKCYDLISKYDSKIEVLESDIILFIKEFEKITTHYLSYGISKKTLDESKEIILQFIEEINSYYKSYNNVNEAISSTLDTITKIEKEDKSKKSKKLNKSKNLIKSNIKKNKSKKGKKIKFKIGDEVESSIKLKNSKKYKNSHNKKENYFSIFFFVMCIIILIIYLVYTKFL